ncbi:MAG: bacillithiol transferase BstA [Acidobacteriaceae bacterium]|nr:bacillithiol transferase BstA [Acidobacteriaceae bacterium]
MNNLSPDTDENLRYPVGRYKAPAVIDSQTREAWIAEIERLPANLRELTAGLSEARLDSPYRPGGWTVRQVVHHLADSHLNSYTRFRLALTEETPSIKAYNEAAWAELADARSAPQELSLSLLQGLHARWTILLRHMTDEDFARTLQHPELGEIRLDWMLGLYAWHCRHHTAHVAGLRSREGW